MASLIGRIAVGQIVPGSAGAQHPKNPVEHGAGILPWSPSLPNWFRVKERLQNRPLGVGEVHVEISTKARSFTQSAFGVFYELTSILLGASRFQANYSLLRSTL